MTKKQCTEKVLDKQRRRLQRRTVPLMYSYGFGQRLIDGVQGRATARTSPCDDINDTPLLQRLGWTYLETVNRVLTQSQSTNHATIRRLEHNLRLLQDQELDVAARRAALRDRATPDTSSRTGGELHLDAAAVAARRLREDQIARSRLHADLEEAIKQREALRAACREDAAVLLEQYALVCAAERMLHAHAQRRAANYARCWDVVRDRAGTVTQVPTPAWAGGPCPWLPGDYARTIEAASATDDPEEEK